VDRALVAAAQRGDAAAWDALVDRHAELLWTTVIDHGLDQRQAAQVCAITWLRCADHLDDVAVLEEIGEWLQGTARRECRSAQADLQRHVAPRAEPNPGVSTDMVSHWVSNSSAPGFPL
jgi:DNA-directed RNA polymerase specialized sigma24 family protein